MRPDSWRGRCSNVQTHEESGPRHRSSRAGDRRGAQGPDRGRSGRKGSGFRVDFPSGRAHGRNRPTKPRAADHAAVSPSCSSSRRGVIGSQMKWRWRRITSLPRESRHALEICAPERPRSSRSISACHRRPATSRKGSHPGATPRGSDGPRSGLISGRSEKQHALRALARGLRFLLQADQIEELKVILTPRRQSSFAGRASRALRAGYSPSPSRDARTSPEIQAFRARSARLPHGPPVSSSARAARGRAGGARDPPPERESAGPSSRSIAGDPRELAGERALRPREGRFTGAHLQRKGGVELASGGTLFLDEIGELSPPLQVKILRYLQDHKIGGSVAARRSASTPGDRGHEHGSQASDA